MSGIKTQWYKNGHATQKRADITVDLKRCDVEVIKKLTDKQKKSLLSFCDNAQLYFDSYIQAIKYAAEVK